MSLKIFNTMTKKKEELKPLKGKDVKLFVCGITEYDHVHLGHARTYAFYDTMVRFLRHSGYNVTYLQNITDVGHLTDDADSGEDKIHRRAKKEKKTPKQIVNYYLKRHLENFDRLRLLRPDIMEKATDHIPEIIKQIQQIMKNGYAYESNGSVYFDVSKFKNYGKLSGKVPKKLKAGARVKVNTEKEDPHDFALWIKAPGNHLQKWDSPWGVGYPGWHIEDTAIAMKHFGKQYHIHGGAIELAFPHHEAEIAQAEAATKKKPYVKYWVHSGLLTINREKMAKSKGNFIRLVDALDRHSPETLRMWIASSHYSKPLDYNEKEITDAKKKVEKIETVIERIKDASKKPNGGNQILTNKLFKLREKFMNAMEDDFNTPLALTHLFEIVSIVNRYMDDPKSAYSTIELKSAEKTIKELGDFFQIIPKRRKKEKVGSEIEKLIKLREEYRKSKKFKEADEIRDKLESDGIVLEDTPSGVRWKKA